MKLIAVILAMFLSHVSCTQTGPGFQFELFKGTNLWELAKAVKEEDIKEIDKYLSVGNIDINTREPKFGQSLLMLAVLNNKYKSVQALIEKKANVDLANFQNQTALHQLTEFNSGSKEDYKMLKLLIEHNADVNLKSDGGQKNGYVYVPLMGAIRDLKQAELLLSNGANLYFKSTASNPDYLIWREMLQYTVGDGILVAKYLIIEKKVDIPEVISYDINNNAQDIFFYIEQLKFNGVKEKEEAKEAILKYLEQIGFPEGKNQVYRG